MVHCGTGPPYLTPINATKYHDAEQGSGNCDEAGSFTYWRNNCRHELNLGTAGKPGNQTVGYQEGKI